MVEQPAFLSVDTFDQQHDAKFIKNHVAPYFTEIYKDLLSREPVGAKGISRMIFQEVSRSVILQYAGLPGIINERFFAVCDINNDLAVQEDEFVKTFTQVFVSDIDAKIGLTFKM